MFLHKIILNPFCREARRDLVNPYEMHSTLCRAFSTPDEKCPERAFLWRLESSNDKESLPYILVQSSIAPDWTRVGVNGWFKKEPGIPVDLVSRLSLTDLRLGQKFRFRLRANPCVCRQGKRQGLMQYEDQLKWIANKGLSHGYKLPDLRSFATDEIEQYDVLISQEQMLRGKKRSGNDIRIYSVQFDGILTVTDIEKFRSAVCLGIGHGKTMGLGLFSLACIE